MNLQSVAVIAALTGAGFIVLSTVATVASGLAQHDLSNLTSIFNSIGFGLMSFGAGGILYTVSNGG
jgi:hypothetical protein